MYWSNHVINPNICHKIFSWIFSYTIEVSNITKILYDVANKSLFGLRNKKHHTHFLKMISLNFLWQVHHEWFNIKNNWARLKLQMFFQCKSIIADITLISIDFYMNKHVDISTFDGIINKNLDHVFHCN